MTDKTKHLAPVRRVSAATLERLANTDVPGGEVYYEGDYLVIRRPDGSIERYDERPERPSKGR